MCVRVCVREREHAWALASAAQENRHKTVACVCKMGTATNVNVPSRVFRLALGGSIMFVKVPETSDCSSSFDGRL